MHYVNLRRVAGQARAGRPGARRRLLEVFGSLMLLEASIYTLTLLISSFCREAGRVAGARAMLAIVSFLVNLIANLWSKTAFLKPLLAPWQVPTNVAES